MSINKFTIKQAHEGLVGKKFTSQELVESCFAQIETVDHDVKAFLTLTKDQALEQAKLVDEKIAKGHKIGELEGIPVALKDNMMTQGVRTTAGSKILDTYKATYNATVVNKLNAAGAVILGKTNMDEFAMGSSTENSAYGATHNPWDLDRVPGGSSGGSAAAVAADECIYALGSDTGGSIRQPASLCGCVGLKPTYGQVSRHGLIAMASSLDQIGPLTKTVEDTAIVFDAIKGADYFDSTSAKASVDPLVHLIRKDVKGMKIGVPKEYFIDGMDVQVVDLVQQAIEQIRGLGAEIVEIDLPHTKYALAAYYVVMPAEVSANMARFDGIRYGYRSPEAKNLLETYLLSREQGLGSEVRRRIMLGTYALSAGYNDAYYKQAQKVRALIRQDFKRAYSKVDAIVTPSSPCVAFKMGEKIDDPLTMYLADIFTVSANIAGIPGLVLPCGFAEYDDKMLPVGLQILGNHFEEEKIFKLGYHYEQINKWGERHALN